MFFQKLLQSSTFRLGLIALVLCGVALMSSGSTDHASAAELQVTAGLQFEQIMPSATSGVVRIVCPPNFVGMNVIDEGYGDISIWSAGCPGAGDIQYWQFSGDSKKANQILAIALSAKSSGRNVAIFYDPNDTSGLADPVLRRKIVGIGVE